jgi:hypothetical protein
MARVFHRRLAMPLWAMALFIVALAAQSPAGLLMMPSTTLFVLALVGTAVLVVTAPRAFPLWRLACSGARVNPSAYRDRAIAQSVAVAKTSVRMLDEPHESTADDALDLLRMDDDGGGQVATARLTTPAPAIAAGVHCGTDKHQPACQARNAATIGSPI